jgi:hypothetical protein
LGSFGTGVFLGFVVYFSGSTQNSKKLEEAVRQAGFAQAKHQQPPQNSSGQSGLETHLKTRRVKAD